MGETVLSTTSTEMDPPPQPASHLPLLAYYPPPPPPSEVCNYPSPFAPLEPNFNPSHPISNWATDFMASETKSTLTASTSVFSFQPPPRFPHYSQSQSHYQLQPPQHPFQQQQTPPSLPNNFTQDNSADGKLDGSSYTFSSSPILGKPANNPFASHYQPTPGPTFHQPIPANPWNNVNTHINPHPNPNHNPYTWSVPASRPPTWSTPHPHPNPNPNLYGPNPPRSGIPYEVALWSTGAPVPFPFPNQQQQWRHTYGYGYQPRPPAQVSNQNVYMNTISRPWSSSSSAFQFQPIPITHTQSQPQSQLQSFQPQPQCQPQALTFPLQPPTARPKPNIKPQTKTKPRRRPRYRSQPSIINPLSLPPPFQTNRPHPSLAKQLDQIPTQPITRVTKPLPEAPKVDGWIPKGERPVPPKSDVGVGVGLGTVMITEPRFVEPLAGAKMGFGLETAGLGMDIDMTRCGRLEDWFPAFRATHQNRMDNTVTNDRSSLSPPHSSISTSTSTTMTTVTAPSPITPLDAMFPRGVTMVASGSGSVTGGGMMEMGTMPEEEYGDDQHGKGKSSKKKKSQRGCTITPVRNLLSAHIVIDELMRVGNGEKEIRMCRLPGEFHTAERSSGQCFCQQTRWVGR